MSRSSTARSSTTRSSTTGSSTSRTRRRSAVLAATAVAVTCAAVPATAANSSGADPRARSRPTAAAPDAGRREVLKALQRDLGLSPDQAERLFTRQSEAGRQARTMPRKLGSSYGGSWYDRHSDKLVVAVTDARQADKVRASGVEVTVVKRSKKSLDDVKKALDAASKKRDRRLSAAVSWSVDERQNRVVLNVRKGKAKSVSTLVKKYGSAVTVKETARRPQVASDFLDGGDAYNGCSVGFNVQRDGVFYFLTAGHCGSVGDTAWGDGDHRIGTFTDSWFPGDDDALVKVENTDWWIPGPWVLPYNGNPDSVRGLKGSADSPVGTAVCKSGRTTGFTCGVITGKDETVNYAAGAVYQLTRHSACVEKGDSGGSNVSTREDGDYADGVTSGAELTSADQCLEKVGEENRSWFQPVAESLNFYGVTLIAG